MLRIYLSRLLGERRMTQAELSAITGIRPNTIGEIYNEVCKTIAIKQIDLICKALNCGITDLIEYIPDK